MGSRVRIVRRIESIHASAEHVDIELVAIPAVRLDPMPGWLTGESLLEQGVEVTMPNLPSALQLPEVTFERWTLRVAAHGDRTVRLLLAPQGNRVFDEKPSWLGIVTDDSVVPSVVTEEDDSVTVSGESFTVVLSKFPFALRVTDRDGKTILRTADRLRQVAGFPLAPSAVAAGSTVAWNFELEATESILGFGEQFGRVEKNGQRLVLRCEDALGTGTGLAYKPVPVWHSTAGYAGFLNTGAVVSVDVGHERPSVFSLDVDDEVADLFLFVSADPAERLRDYTTLAGRSQLPPLWAFGYWMGRCRYHSRAEVLGVARQMNEHAIPCDVLHLDPDWLVTDRLNTDFIWNEDRFGARKSFVDELADEGKRLSVWELPYVDPASPIYSELEANGYFVKTTQGVTAHLGGTPTPDGRERSLIDFSNPAAREWWIEQHRPFLDDGVAVFKTDFGEGFPKDGVLAEDTPRTHHHNLYPLRYNASTSEAIARVTGRTPLVWGRSGWAGSHRYPGQWGGDAESTVAGMQATVRGGLSYALSAPGFWSHDIGGFFGPELTEGLYVRWTQLGAFSPLMRAHGLRPREPWAFGVRALNISREWIRRRYELLPYLWNTAASSVARGLPMMRPLYLAFPHDPIAVHIDSQFMLGDDLLIVPIFDSGDDPVERTFYVPDGRWTDLYDGTLYDGGRYHSGEFGLETMPVLVRDNAVIPTLSLGAEVRNTDELVDLPWTLLTFGDGALPALIGFDGAQIDADQLEVVARTAR